MRRKKSGEQPSKLEYVKMEKLAKKLEEIKKKLPLKTLLTDSEGKIWDEFMEIENEYNKLSNEIWRKLRRQPS